MSDPLLDQLSGEGGPLDPGPAFRDRLWRRVEQELDRTADAAPVPVASVVHVDTTAPPKPRAIGLLGWIRASRTRSVPAAAAVLALFSLGLGLAVRDRDDRGGDQSVRVVDDVPTAAPSTGPSPGRLGPPPVVGLPSARTASPGATAGASARGPRAVPPAVPARRATATPLLVVYGASTSDANFEVFTVVGGSDAAPRRLVPGPGYDANPVMSPGGNRIAWTRSEDDYEVRTIWTAAADGSGARELLLPTCPAYLACEYRWPTYSGDGSRLAFTRSSAQSDCTAAERCNQIVVHDPQSGSLRAVGYGDAAHWSPRRPEIVYAGSEGPSPRSRCEVGVCNDQQIRIVDVSGPTPTSRAVGDELGHSPRFSPDGEWIAFERGNASTGGGAVMRRDGSDVRELPGCTQPNWAPDGRLACVVTVGGGADVFLLDADDEPAQRLTFTGAFEAQFQLYAL